MRTFGDPFYVTSSVERYQQRNVPYRAASTVLLPAIFFGSCAFYSKAAILSILCREVELCISSGEKCQRGSTLREEELSSGNTSIEIS